MIKGLSPNSALANYLAQADSGHAVLDGQHAEHAAESLLGSFKVRKKGE